MLHEVDGRWDRFSLREMGVPQRLFEQEVTDATDDFDLVTTEPFPDPREPGAMTFTALDGEERTDTWFSNQREVTTNADPWDPDTDDDGLTDGQEERFFTHDSEVTDCYWSWGYRCEQIRSVRRDIDMRGNTNATDPDTDGDGYWDGWIGVYGVGRTDNVVLYRHNLQDGIDDWSEDVDGIHGEEIVQEQIRLHDENETATAMAADVDGDGVDEHSTVHIGERQWRTDPTSASSAETPDPSLEIEADYFTRINDDAIDREWEQAIEDNYAIYDINVTFVDVPSENDPLGPSDLCEAGLEIHGWCIEGADHGPPVTDNDVEWIKNQYQNTDSLYMIVITTGSPVPAVDPGGTVSVNNQGQHSRWIEIFTQGHSRLENVPSRRLGLDGSDRRGVAVRKTAVHEIGHVFDVGDIERHEYGVADNEVYSGCPPRDERPENYGCRDRDPTPEYIRDRIQDATVREWSIMSSSTRGDQYLPPTNDDYFAFSLEELFTANTGDPATGG